MMYHFKRDVGVYCPQLMEFKPKLSLLTCMGKNLCNIPKFRVRAVLKVWL